MSQHSRDLLESVSHYCYVRKSPYLYENEKTSGLVSGEYTRYDKGQFRIYTWVDELCFYYLKKEALIYQEFISALHLQQSRIKEQLPPSSYREGLLTALDDILHYIDKKR